MSSILGKVGITMTAKESTELATPGRPVPPFTVSLTNGGQWSSDTCDKARITLVNFYRGHHCPRCKLYLMDYYVKRARFAERNVNLVAISCNSIDRAQRSVEEWGLEEFDLGYGLSINDARAWRLFISNAITESEPRQFAEPGLALIQPDGVLYSLTVGSTPFHRPHATDVLEALDAISARDYPPRGDA